MQTKAERHAKAGTLEQFRARQKASRQSALAQLTRAQNAPRVLTLEERVDALEA